jgi:septum site-determining protein MinD
MGESLLVTSGKGGVGKSTFAVNCGAALARMGRRVLLIDGDAGLRALDLMLSVSDRVVYDLADVLGGRCEPIKAIVKTDIGGLSLLPAPLDAQDGIFEPGGMQQLCRGLRKYYDYVVIDSAAGIGECMRTSACAADRAVVVSTPDPVSVRDADRAASVVLAQGVGSARLVLNRVVPRLMKAGAACSLDAAIDGTSLQLIGAVPEDEKIAEAAFKGVPAVILGNSPAARAFCNIARRLEGGSVPLLRF